MTPHAMETGKELSWITWTLMIVAGFVLVVGVIVPNYIRLTYKPVENACVYNLRTIQKAKQKWAKGTGADGEAVPSLGDIAPYLGRDATRKLTRGCPVGGPTATNFESCYEMGAVTNPPRCKIMPQSHVLQ